MIKMATLKDDYWTPDNINLLTDKRIARDAVFKQTNSDRLGWLQVAGDMKRDGGSKALNRINVRKQWFKICELYKKSLGPGEEEIRNELMNTPYYNKLRQFFEKINTSSFKSKCMNQEFRKKMTARIFKLSSYADRWTVNRTNSLIDAKIARHSMFKGRGHAANAWKTISQDVIGFDEPYSETVTVQQVKKKWENLFTKYKTMHQTQTYDTKWPHLKKMHYFYNEVYNSEGNKKKNNDVNSECAPFRIENENSPAVAADRWPTSRTKLLIERRIARSSMFGRGMSAGGWQAVLNDLIVYGAPPDLTIANVKKKWENLLTRFKIINDLNTKQSTWPYYEQMEKYHELKKSQKYKDETFEVDVEDLLSEEPMDFQGTTAEDNSPISLEKLTKCRLCQKNNGIYSIIEDKEFCDRIFECTSINVYVSIELLPSLVCEDCKTSIGKFYEFRSVCHDIDNELRASLEQVVIKTENNSDDNSFEIDTREEVVTQETLECPECPASFTSSEALVTHVKSHKTSIKYHCEICNTSFTKQSSLFAHIKQHFEMTKLETVEMDDVEVEYLIEENGIDNNDNTENCDIVEKKISTELLQCELCSKTFLEEKCLKDHFDTHSRTEHHCPRENCNKKFTTLNSLRHHEMRHLGINSYLCTICGKGFVTNNALRMHEKIHAVVKEHICEICSRGFSVLSNLRAHKRKHHDGHRFYCSQCPKEFLTKSSLQRHELVHTGVKEFICDTCSSAFFTLKELRKHKRYHEGMRLHHCNECFKTFFEKHHLTIHMRCHTGERPYACTIPGCNKSFREKQKLHRHEKTPHRLTQPV